MALIKDIIAIRKEEAATKKALRELNKKHWSIEFLTAMLVKAARIYGSGLEMTITSPTGSAITIKSIDALTTKFKEDDIFHHLDDEARVRAFINHVTGGKV